MELFKKLGLKSGIRNLLAASSENTLLLLKSTVCEISSSHNLREYCFIFWSRKWQHTPVFLPGMFHRQRSLMGYSPRDHKDSDVNSETTFAVFALSHPTFVTPWAVTHQASVLHHLPEFVQTHVHWVGDPIQLSHPLSSLSPFTFNLSQHQGSFPMNRLFISKYWRPKCWCPKCWSFSISCKPVLFSPLLPEKTNF